MNLNGATTIYRWPFFQVIRDNPIDPNPNIAKVLIEDFLEQGHEKPFILEEFKHAVSRYYNRLEAIEFKTGMEYYRLLAVLARQEMTIIELFSDLSDQTNQNPPKLPSTIETKVYDPDVYTMEYFMVKELHRATDMTAEQQQIYDQATDYIIEMPTSLEPTLERILAFAASQYHNEMDDIYRDYVKHVFDNLITMPEKH